MGNKTSVKTKFRYYQLIPGKGTNLNINSSKILLNDLSSLTRPRLFDRYLSQPEFKLIIDNGGKNNKLRFIIAAQSAIDTYDIKKIISDIDPLIEIKPLKLEKVDGLRTSYSLKRHYAYSFKLSGNNFTSLLNTLSSKKVSLRLEISLKSTFPLKASYLRKKLLAGQTPKLFASYGQELIKKLTWHSIMFVVRILQALKYITEEIVSSKSPHRRLDRASLMFIENPGSIKLLDKLYDDLWLTDIETTVQTKSINSARKINNQIKRALSADHKSHQSLVSGKPFGARSNNILSNSELSRLFYIPDNNLFESSNFNYLPPPRELIQPSPGSVVIGDNIYSSDTSAIRLSRDARSRHTFMVGATGTGKSTLLYNLITQDIAAGHGLSLIDPHGDLANSLIKIIPKDRKTDVIYFDPTDINYPVGLNLLEIKAPKDSPEYRLELDLVVESVVSLFRKLFSDDGESGGHRIEYLIRNSIYSVMSLGSPTIFSVYKVLTDQNYRQKVVDKLNNPDLINFWNEELGKAGDYQRVKMTAGVTSKIGRLLSSAASRRVFGQQNSTIDFDEVLNGKILICNFSKGKLGEDLSRVFGISVLTKLQMAALKRANVSFRQRQSHYLYIDEFQNFATPVASQLISETRKYGVSLTLANQSLSQLDSSITATVLANVGNVISFRTSFTGDEIQLLGSFKPYLTKGDLMNLPQFNAYLKCHSLNLPPTSIKIRQPIKEKKSNQAEVIASSRKRYALKLRHAA